jgi:hypothetical protein
LPAGIGLFLALLLTLVSGCGDGTDEATVPAPSTPAATTPAATEGEATGVGIGQAEALTDVPFMLNADQPVPPDFAEAYQRRALITVQFGAVL